MSKPKLTYFDAPVSRGEECRLALYLAGIAFEDDRIQRAAWPALKPTTPYGSLPTLAIEGRPVLAHSNAILVYVGRAHDLHPKDDFEAARHEGMMLHVEDLRGHITPSMRMTDDAERKKAREALATGYVPAWAGFAEKQIAGPFFAGEKLHVADLKLYVVAKWLMSGVLDHIPATVLDPFTKLRALHDAVRDHAGVRAWYAAR